MPKRIRDDCAAEGHGDIYCRCAVIDIKNRALADERAKVCAEIRTAQSQYRVDGWFDQDRRENTNELR